MLKTIILIYIIILTLYFYVRKKQSTTLLVYNYGQFIVQIIFVLFYALFIKSLNMFRDLNKLDIDINLVLFFIFKISWFKFHYVMMCETNFNIKIINFYKFIFYNFVYSPAYYIYINYLMISFLLILVSYNSFVLDYSLIYLKYYSFFRMVYISYKFMSTKQSLVLDYYSYNLMYPGNSTKFKNYINDKHTFLISESKKYINGVILEKDNYLPQYLGDLSSIIFFKNYRN